MSVLDPGSVPNRKFFCIGLHKTGTTSLHAIAKRCGMKAIHSTNWMLDPAKLSTFDFFCDGGSHFDNLHEFEFENLYNMFPGSRFILQTRDTRSWIISKLVHAGWTDRTAVESDIVDEPRHSEWTKKSLITVDRLIAHKWNYERKVARFFRKNDSSRFLLVNIVDQKSQESELAKFLAFLGFPGGYLASIPHLNRTRSASMLPEEVVSLIDKKIANAPPDLIERSI